MTEDEIYVGSRVRVWLPGVNRRSGTEEALDPAALTVTVWRPDGSMFAEGIAPGVQGGVPYIDFAEGELNQPSSTTTSAWRAQGYSAGFRSAIVEWAVLRNPG